MFWPNPLKNMIRKYYELQDLARKLLDDCERIQKHNRKLIGEVFQLRCQLDDLKLKLEKAEKDLQEAKSGL